MAVTDLEAEDDVQEIGMLINVCLRSWRSGELKQVSGLDPCLRISVKGDKNKTVSRLLILSSFISII